MKTVVIEGKVFKIPSRYTDKRRVEKEIFLYKNRHNKKKKVKPKELRIPVMYSTKLTYLVRESNMYKDRWVKHLGGVKRVTEYIEAYKKNYDIKN